MGHAKLFMSLRRAAASVGHARAHLEPSTALRALWPARGLFNFNFSKFAGVRKDQGRRKLFDVEWHDEFASLGDDARQTHKFMVDEDQRLRKSTLFLAPLRRQVFEELVKHRARFKQVCDNIDVTVRVSSSTARPNVQPRLPRARGHSAELSKQLRTRRDLVASIRLLMRISALRRAFNDTRCRL